MKNKTNFGISILLISLFSFAVLAANQANKAHAENEAVDASNWDTHLLVSQGEAIRPAIASNPNNKTVIVTYTNDNTANPYYSFSTNFGMAGSWTKHKLIYSSATASAQTDVTFDNNNNAHVVWVENDGLAYKKINNLNTGAGTLKLFTESILDAESGVLNPQVVTYNQYVHIIGITGSGPGNLDLFHVYSADGGATWNPNTVKYISSNPLRAERPAVTVDANGNLHVVYNQQILPNLFNTVNYAKGSFNGSTVSWNVNNHVDIANKIPAGTYEVLEPSIIDSNGLLKVSATQKNNPASGQAAPQYVYLFSCSGSCTNANNWNPQRISGPALYINESPHELVSSVVNLGGCTNIVFDGKRTTNLNPAEQVYNSTSCSGWGSSREELTQGTTTRSIQPAATTHNNWWMYVAYEEFADATHKIYFVRNIPGVYLPVIIR